MELLQLVIGRATGHDICARRLRIIITIFKIYDPLIHVYGNSRLLRIRAESVHNSRMINKAFQPCFRLLRETLFKSNRPVGKIVATSRYRLFITANNSEQSDIYD